MSWSCTSLTTLSPNRVEPLSTANIAKDVGSIFIFNFFMWTASLGGLEQPGRAVRISVFEMLFKVCSRNLDPKIWKRPNIRGKQLAWQREQCDDHFWSWAFGYWHAFVWNLEVGDLWQKLSWTTCEAFFIPKNHKNGNNNGINMDELSTKWTNWCGILSINSSWSMVWILVAWS